MRTNSSNFSHVRAHSGPRPRPPLPPLSCPRDGARGGARGRREHRGKRPCLSRPLRRLRPLLRASPPPPPLRTGEPLSGRRRDRRRAIAVVAAQMPPTRAPRARARPNVQPRRHARSLQRLRRYSIATERRVSIPAARRGGGGSYRNAGMRPWWCGWCGAAGTSCPVTPTTCSVATARFILSIPPARSVPRARDVLGT